MSNLTPDQIRDALREPFAPDAVKWKPQTVKDNRAMAVAYIDPRMVMKRLDDVLGLDGWQESYRETKTDNVICTLSVRIGDGWVQREGIGTPSGQPDASDRAKAAFSEALKLAAVKLGIGRYLYELPKQWVDYDPKKKQLTARPTLPAWAVPDSHKPAGAKVADTVTRLAVQYCNDARRDVTQYTSWLLKELGYADPKVPIASVQLRHAQAMRRKITADMEELVNGKLPDHYPKTGSELAHRVNVKDGELSKAFPKHVGLGKLTEAVVAAGVKEGLPSDMAKWTGNKAMRIGVDAVAAFVSALPKQDKPAANTGKAAGSSADARDDAKDATDREGSGDGADESHDGAGDFEGDYEGSGDEIPY